MANVLEVQVSQVGPTTSEAAIRTHRVLVDRPIEKRGEDRGAMGGELLLAGLGGCFLSNLLAAINAREAAISNVKARVAGTLDTSPARFTAIEMRISAECEDYDLLEKLVTIAERACIVSNTLRDALELKVIVDREDRA